MKRGLETFTDASGALSLAAPAAWQLGRLDVEGGVGMLIAERNLRVANHELGLAGTSAIFAASASLPARLGISDPRDAWFAPLTDWIAEEIGFLDDAGGAYGGGEAWYRDSDFNGGMFHGVSRIWRGCGDAGRTMRDLAMVPIDRSFVAYLRLAYLPAEEAIADSILHTFEVDGAVLAEHGLARQGDGFATPTAVGPLPSPT